MKKRVLSGMRPTSKLHLGNFLGALENWKRFEGNDCFYMIADLHALTTEYNGRTDIKDTVLEVAVDYLAAGIDPDKVTLFVQSAVKEHVELGWILAMVTPIPWLERNPTYKEMVQSQPEKELNTFGFLGYPVLQAADILLYSADVVPVGDDQLPHIELTREIARRFNNIYGKVFKEPEAALTKTPRIPGTDGRKMSKSFNNAVFLADAPADISKKIRKMVTDPARKRREDKGHPEVCPVFTLHQRFSPKELARIEKECRSAEIGCTDCKEILTGHLTEFLKPIYEKRQELIQQKKRLYDILEAGNEKARAVASEMLGRVKEAVGI
ncbi:MAG: tryptophan--tRNA ligase [Candidatus Omnitrophica bacterium]|nr:tryptophan--tRNA ligase [Candidatus Omnitrophota bacterium]